MACVARLCRTGFHKVSSKSKVFEHLLLCTRSGAQTKHCTLDVLIPVSSVHTATASVGSHICSHTCTCMVDYSYCGNHPQQVLIRRYIHPKVVSNSLLKCVFARTIHTSVVKLSKSKGKQGSKGSQSLSDSESDSDSDSDSDDDLHVDDEGLPSNYKDIKVNLKSLRVDAIVSSGLNIARNKVDDYFLGSKLRLNGERILKKAKQVKIDDCIDLISEYAGDGMKVKRVRILGVADEKTRKDRLMVRLRVWRGNVHIDNPEDRSRS